MTASLQVDYLRPTPIGPELVLWARPVHTGSRAITVGVRVMAGEVETARGRVVAAPESMLVR